MSASDGQDAIAPSVFELLRRVGIDEETLAAVGEAPALTDDFERDAATCAPQWRRLDDLQRRLGGAVSRTDAEAAAVVALREHAIAAREPFLDRHADALYRRLTDDRRRFMRLEPLVEEAARLVPGLTPTAEVLAEEGARRQGDKPGLELQQGMLLSKLAARPEIGHHLCHAMLLPLEESHEALARFRRDGGLDLGTIQVERRGAATVVTLSQPELLNCEDDTTMAPFETAVDVALLDPETRVGVLRGGATTHPKYAGRNLFGSGINLTRLYWGRIPYIFYLVRDMGLVNKLYRGVARPDRDPSEVAGGTVEKLWIAALEGFAIGGACQLLLVVDHVIAERGAYMSLPARKEGIIPGMANLRLPRLVGDHLARQAIMNDRKLDCDSPEGRLICDEIVEPGQMSDALDRTVKALTGSGMVSAAGNRRAMRIGQEPLDLFRQYVAVYAREQAYCHLSPALVANLERYWNAQNRNVA